MLRVAELWLKCVLSMLFTYLLFIDDSDVTIEHAILLFMALNYRIIIMQLMDRLCPLIIVIRSR